MGLIGTVEAARRLGITRSLVARYVRQGRLAAQRIGSVYLIDEKALARFTRRPPGRPKGKT